jgi:hypothetical protein
MPIYELKNNETGEIFEKMMSISAYEEYLKENPHIQRHFTTLHFQDSISLGITKPPVDFQKGVLDKIKKNNPGHNMQSRWETPREW